MTIEHERDDFDTVDQAALDRAIELTLAENDPGRAEQIKSFLAENGWHYAASFCASHQQSKNLSLKPWEVGPCSIDLDEVDKIISEGPTRNPRNEFAAAKLLQKMLANGVSPFDPTPLASLAAKRK